MLTAYLDQVFRRESGRVLATLIRQLGDFTLAEDALQDACAKALEVWPRDGLPENPAAWLTTVARRRSLDLLRRRKAAPAPTALLPEVAVLDEPWEEDEAATIPDDRLRLLFTCCHPALNQPAQVGLALRTLGGLSTREIARAFIEPESATAQRLVRAKAKIKGARIPYEVPDAAELPARLAAILEIIYLIFNEGYAAAENPSFLRVDLGHEAIRLGRLLVELLPAEAEAKGLLALMLLHDARRTARVRDGELVPLEEQDRGQWDRERIAEGTALLNAALLARQPGPYQIQAAVAALHGAAATPAQTDWPQIAALYGALLRHAPSPVVALNAAAATAMAGSLDEGLKWMEELEGGGELAGYHLLPAAKADLLRRAKRLGEAADEYRKALALAKAPAERSYLERRLGECAPRL